VIRRVGDSPLTPFLGGGAAVLLQAAHPLVAAGIVGHSDYRRDLWTRLMRTMRALYLIIYGNKMEAEAAGAAVRAVHAHVRGETTVPLGSFPTGTRYSAEDPRLMLWVHGTLVHCSLAVYSRFVSALSGDEQERYYREMGIVARIIGTPSEVLPSSLGEFRAWFAEMLESGEIVVTPPAREIAEVILEPPLPAPMRLIAPAHRIATAALLPTGLRRDYGLRWRRTDALALPLAGHALHYAAVPLFRAAAHLATPGDRLAA
jgi:uncharacterized protein (DUF2236 family)